MKNWFLLFLLSSGIGFAQITNPALENNPTYEEGSYGARKKGALPAFSWIFASEFPQGVRHIFTGADHIAFILALALVVFTAMQLIKVVTFFTIAHALTLTIASLDLFPIGATGVRWIEFGVALSIAWVGIENLIYKERIPIRRRSAIAFGFGLIHGLAFSEHFRESMVNTNLSDPAHLFRFLTKILGFNLGVDAGQLVIAFSVFFMLAFFARRMPEANFFRLRHKFILYGSSTISIFGVLWSIERIGKILGN